jgi:hypothetical protein
MGHLFMHIEEQDRLSESSLLVMTLTIGGSCTTPEPYLQENRNWSATVGLSSLHLRISRYSARVVSIPFACSRLAGRDNSDAVSPWRGQATKR